MRRPRNSKIKHLLYIITFNSLSPLEGFPGGSEVKVSASNVGDPGSIPGLGRSPGEGNGNPLQIFLPGESHGLRGLVGKSVITYNKK